MHGLLEICHWLKWVTYQKLVRCVHKVKSSPSVALFVALFVWLIQQYFTLRTNKPPATSSSIFLSEQISIRHLPNEQAVWLYTYFFSVWIRVQRRWIRVGRPPSPPIQKGKQHRCRLLVSRFQQHQQPEKELEVRRWCRSGGAEVGVGERGSIELSWRSRM
jgi:hypothetical protein